MRTMADKINYAKTVRAAKKGDLNAYQALYDSTVNDVAAICKKLLNSSTDPESVIVDTYITIFQSLESMKNPKAFPTYAADAAATQCYNANQLRPAAPADLGAPQTALDVTEDTLNALNNGQRTALLLQSQGMSNAEIADIMGVTEYTVNSDIYFGKKKLQKAVAAHRPTISFDEYGVGNDVTDQLLEAYSGAIYENVPGQVRTKQFDKIMNIFEGNEEPAHVDEPIAPEVKTSPAGEETVVDEPKAETPFFVPPEPENNAAPTDETQEFSTSPYIDEEPTQVAPPSFNEEVRKQSSFNTRSTEPKQTSAPKKTSSVPKQTAAVSRDSGNTKKVLMTVIIVLLVAILVTLIIVFATRNRSVEEVTTAPAYTSSFTLENTTQAQTQSQQTRRRTTQEDTTEAQTEAETTRVRTEPATHATQAQTHAAESGGGENGVVEF